MTRVHGDPDAFAIEALAGFASAYAEHVRLVPGGVVRATVGAAGKVSVVVGGGSGHYPAFAGYVGHGLADAAVAGDVFASPSTQTIVDVARAADRGGGIVLGFGNYAGDVLNFGLAATQLNDDGVRAATIAVTDDVASAGPDDRASRRGVAGDLVVFKVAGAAAEQGRAFDDVVEIAELANERTRTLGVAFSGCTLPGKSTPLFSLDPGRMGLGMGIHGEPGISERELVPADELADLLVDPLVAEAPAGSGARVAAILNGLGGTKYEELFVLWYHLGERFARHGLDIVAPSVGELVTSLDMAGCSLTLAWLDDELEPLWRAAADTPAFVRGRVRPTGPGRGGERSHQTSRADRASNAAPALPASTGDAVDVKYAEPRSRRAAEHLLLGAVAVAEALERDEDELGALDAIAGDGDHGQGMRRGAVSGRDEAIGLVDAGAGAATVLSGIGRAWAARAGGTSGALWGAMLSAASSVLSDDDAPDAQVVADAVAAACEALIEHGGASVGDKTIVDAIVPFNDRLRSRVGEGAGLAEAWSDATRAAQAAADRTADLRPKRGRARPLGERSIGHADPGATSFATVVAAIAPLLAGSRGNSQLAVDIERTGLTWTN